VIERCGGALGLERLGADGGEEHGVERERGAGRAGHGEMTEVGWVKTAAEESNAGSRGHEFIVARRVGFVR